VLTWTGRESVLRAPALNINLTLIILTSRPHALSDARLCPRRSLLSSRDLYTDTRIPMPCSHLLFLRKVIFRVESVKAKPGRSNNLRNFPIKVPFDRYTLRRFEMVETKSRLPPAERKAVTIMERKFTELAEKYCPDRSGEFCEKTGKRCSLESCPKMKERIQKRSE